MSYAESDLLPISGLQHLAYCERQWALIHLNKVWREDIRTAEGRIMHDRVHDPAQSGMFSGVYAERGLPIRSLRLGIAGEADVVEFHEDSGGIAIPNRAGRWTLVPIEYKRGRPKERTDADTIQLCAQTICLEEMLQCEIGTGYLFYGETRHRFMVALDHALRERTADLARRMHELYDAGLIPPEPGESSKCKNCSLLNACFPPYRMQKSASRYWDTVFSESDDE